MPTLAPPAGRLVLRSPDPIFYAAPVDSGADPAVWRSEVGGSDGSIAMDLTGIARLGVITRTLNTWATVDVVIPKSELTALAECSPWATELRIYRNDVLQFVGPFDGGYSASAARGERKLSASGLERYLTKRLRKAPILEPVNLLKNPRFDDGFSAWGVLGSPAIDSGESETGTQSVDLAAGDLLNQVLVYSNFLAGAAYTLRLTCRIKLSSDADGEGTVGRIVDKSVPNNYKTATARIGLDTPREVWTSITCDLTGRCTTLGVMQFDVEALWTGSGTLSVDHLNLTVVDYDASQLSSLLDLPEQEEQQMDLVAVTRDSLAAHRDLNIGFSASGAGQVRVPEDGTPKLIWELARSIAEGGDKDVGVVASRFVRTFTVWPDRRGRVIDPEELTLTFGEHFTDYSWDGNAGRGVNKVVVTANGKTASATDLTRFDGFLLEDVRGAPSADWLDEPLARYAQRELTMEPELPPLELANLPCSLIGTVGLGDRVTVALEEFDVDIDSQWRVVGQQINPATDRWAPSLISEPAP